MMLIDSTVARAKAPLSHYGLPSGPLVVSVVS